MAQVPAVQAADDVAGTEALIPITVASALSVVLPPVSTLAKPVPG